MLHSVLQMCDIYLEGSSNLFCSGWPDAATRTASRYELKEKTVPGSQIAFQLLQRPKRSMGYVAMGCFSVAKADISASRKVYTATVRGGDLS